MHAYTAPRTGCLRLLPVRRGPTRSMIAEPISRQRHGRPYVTMYPSSRWTTLPIYISSRIESVQQLDKPCRLGETDMSDATTSPSAWSWIRPRTDHQRHLFAFYSYAWACEVFSLVSAAVFIPMLLERKSDMQQRREGYPS